MDQQALTNAIVRGVTFLSKEQVTNGCFLSQSSTTNDNFYDAPWLHATFSTSLILSSLSTLPQTEEIKKIMQRGSHFLFNQKSPRWSFNYWTRNAPETKTHPYPDDLDDTFCALSALFHANPKCINAETLAHIVKLLTMLEVKEGGPYRTWLVGNTSSKVWKDTDVAVNSNIAYFLSLNNIHLPALTRFIELKIKKGELNSPYYPSSYPIIYFISKWYQGKYTSELRQFLISKKEKNDTWGTPLNTALAISSLLNLHYPPDNLSKSILSLTKKQNNGSWNAYGFCYDPSRDGNKYFSGSQALTTTFCLEALSNYQQSLLKIEETHKNTRFSNKQERIYASIMEQIARRLSLFDYPIRKQARELIAKLTKNNTDRQIPLLPYYFSEAIKRKKQLPESLLVKLGVANIFGWLAYTIYDNFLDDEPDPQSLPLANIALREVTRLFQEVLPKNSEWQTLFHTIIDQIDNANAWEVLHCRVKMKNGSLILTSFNIPRYGAYQKLAQKSLGHGLGPLAILFSLGYTQKSPEVKNLIKFFKNYLIAKQLNDDAHDWEKDLAMGQINPICAMILEELTFRKRKKLSLQTSIKLPQKIFWDDTLEKISRVILRHTNQAKRIVSGETLFRDRSFFEKLLSPYENGAKNAIKEKQNATVFIQTYNYE